MELSNKEFIDDRESVLSNRTLDITLAGQHKKTFSNDFCIFVLILNILKLCNQILFK
jgi:hypothetical protein